MYQVSYRKYRPRFFSDVVGQPQVTVTLKNELKSGRIAHAYLLTGSRGTGKTTCAKILAKAVNCLNLRDGDPCGECEICRGLDDGSVLDVVEIDAASNNGVDSIRALIEESNFTPATAKYRVYIIDEVHMLSAAAFNALLKTLEEPPPHVIFILATTEVHKLLPTILSRCQRFDFKRIAPEAVAGRLEFVAEKENGSVDRDAALLIARLADGALRDALSLLDQCMGRGSHVTLDIVNETAGIAGRDYLTKLAQAVADCDTAGAMELIDTLHRNSKDMNRLCEETAEYFRGLMVIKTTRKPEEIIIVSPDEMNVMTKQALGMNLSVILHGLDTFEKALNNMRYANGRTELEMAFVRLCSPELDSTPEALIRRIEALETGNAVIPRRQLIKTESISETEQKARKPVPSNFVPAAGEKTPQPTPMQEVQPKIPPKAETKAVPEEQEKIGFDLDMDEPMSEKEPELPGQTVFEAVAEPKPQTAVINQSPEELAAGAERFREWPEILDAMRAYSASIAAAFRGSSAYVNGDYMLIEAPQIAFDLLKRQSQRQQMRDTVQRVTGKVYKLGPYIKPSAQGKSREDPLAGLERRAKEAGIDLEFKEE